MPNDSDQGQCRACPARIIWATTPKGAKAPIDVEPHELGDVLLLRHSELGVLAVTLTKDALDAARAKGVGLRTNHFITCPERSQFSRAQGPVAVANA